MRGLVFSSHRQYSAGYGYSNDQRKIIKEEVKEAAKMRAVGDVFVLVIILFRGAESK